MFLSAMDLGWKRIHHLVVLLIFLKHAVGDEGWTSQNVQPQQNLPVRKLFSLRKVQSSVLEAPVSGSVPVEEVASNMFAGKSLNPSSSLFSLSSQSVKGGFSSSYEPMSHTQSGSDSISSLLPLQGSSSPNAQNVVSRSDSRLGSYSWSTLSSQDASGVQGVSAQPASTPVRGGSTSGLFILSQSSPSLSTPDSLSKLSFSPLGVSALPTSDQSSSNMFTASSQSNSVLQLGGASSLLSTPSSSSTGSSGSSRRHFTSHQGSSGPQLAGGSSQLVSTSGLLTQSSTGSQSTPGSLYAKLATPHFAPMQTGSTFTGGSSLQLQGTSTQYAPVASDAKVPVYRQAVPSGSLSLSQLSQWQPSSRWSQGVQTSGTVASQSSSPSKGFKAPSKFSTLSSAASPSQTASTQERSGRYSGLSIQSQSTASQYSPGSSGYSKLAASPLGVSQSTSGPSSYSQYTSSSQSRAGTKLAGTSHFEPMQTGSTFTGGSSLQLQGTSTQCAPAALDAKVPVYSQAAPSGPLSMSQPSRWQPSSRWSRDFQTSGAVASQSSSPSKGFKAPSKFSTLTSAASPSQTTSTKEGSGRYSGLSSLAQGTLSQYSPGSLAYAKQGSSLLDVSSQSTSDQSSSGLYTSSSQSKAGLYAPKQTGSASTDGSSLQLQRPSLSLSQPSKWQTSRWSQGFQTSGTVASQSSFPSKGFKAPSKFSTLSSAASPSQTASTQERSGRYSGLSIQSQSTTSQYSPGLSGYSKLAASHLGVSQSTSGPSSYSQDTSSSQSRTGLYAPKQTGSASTDGSSLQLQRPSLSLSQPSKWQTSRWSQGFQTSGAVASQSSSPSKGFKAPSKFSTLSSAASPSQTASTHERSGRYSGLSIQSTTSQYSPGSSGYSKFAASHLGVSQSTSGPSSYSQDTSSSQSRTGLYAPKQTGSGSTDGSSLQLQGPSMSSSQPSKWQTTSRWLQGFQTSGTVALQSGSPPQGSKVPSRFSTLGSAASPGQFASTQEESGRSSGLSSLAQGTLSQYSPGSPAYAEQGSSLDVSSQSTSDQSSSGLYASSSQSMAGTSHYVPVQTGSTFTGGSSFQSQGTSSQNAPAPLGGKVPVYSEAAPSGSSLSMSWPSQLQSSVSRSQSLQTSGTVTSQSSSPSQGFKAPSRFSTPAGSPGQLASKQKGTGRYSGLSTQSQSTSSQYSPGHSAYAKLAASPLGVSQSTSGQSSYGQYASSSQSRAGTKLASTSHFAPMRTGSTFTGGSSLQLQGTSTQYAPASSDAKVLVYSQAAPSGSLSLSQPSQWQPSSRWSQGFQTSGAVASQSSSPSKGFKAPSKFSTLSSAASPSQTASTQERSGRYSGLSIQSQSTTSQYSPGSSGYSKLAASRLGVSQSTSGPSSYSQDTSSSQSRTGLYAPKQTGSGSTDGSSLQLQGPSLSLSQPSKWQASRWSQGFQTSSSPSKGFKAPSKFSTLSSAASPSQTASTQEGSGRSSSLAQGTLSQYSPGSPAYAKQGSSLLDVSSQSTNDQSSSGMYASSSQGMVGTSRYVPVQTGSTFTGGSSFQSQGTSNQYAPSVSSQYTQASRSGSSLTGLAASGKWQNSASTWGQGFQDSGAAVPQSSSSPQSSWTSCGSSVPPAMSPSVDSVAQSSSSGSRRASSFFGVGLGPSKLSAQAASGSAISSQISPALSASFQHSSDSMTSSLGSGFQGASQGTFSGQSSDSTSVISSSYGSTYGQEASGFSRSSQRSSATGRYSSVKG